MNVKYSYGTRDYQHMNDNDYGHTDNPFLGVLASQVPIGPLSFEGCFGGFEGKNLHSAKLLTQIELMNFQLLKLMVVKQKFLNF